MINKLRPTDPCSINDNVFKAISSDWMLVTAGDLQSYNTMTASWGAFGELWHKKICICFVRPTRYTFKFMEQTDAFTLSFFDESFRDVLKYCGTKSGRDVNKMSFPELTAVAGTTDSVYFAESRLVMECRKIYTHDLDPNRFIDSEIQDEYPRRDYHRMYIGEIIQCLIK
ncbi:MAG: flavin reductase family protein [Candidatus Zixiibacteriota bacterium]|nr:MAG: flavin reductase family protein [candidate division Zixibacteria bacterium]